MNIEEFSWQTKVAARLHDPAEKALVLLRDPAGHENGTSRALSRLLGLNSKDAESIDNDNDQVLAHTLFPKGLAKTMYRHVQRADWWAAAADRPQWPMEEITVNTAKSGERTFKVAPWAQVHWTKKPVLVHPLSGEQYDLGRHGGLGDTDFRDFKERSFRHHADLLALLDIDTDRDWKKILLALWRFAPGLHDENDNHKLGELWKLLPADTRIPDHSIWDHLDLTSAFAGAFAADPEGEAALLTMSIGPVQSFIAAARKMEDLWAGSHLLARLSWEAMRVVCEQLGPDAILFPRLREVPQVDVWLRDSCGLPAKMFENCDWNRGATDSNPMFTAALPNRFVAVVPAGKAAGLAAEVRDQVHKWLGQLGEDVLARLLKEADINNTPDLYCHQQMREQIRGFPDVHWAIVPFSLIGIKNPDRQTGLDTAGLSAAMRPFFEAGDNGDPGFLGSPAWRLLQDEISFDHEGKKSVFFAPNPGVLYPAVHDLAERSLAAAKTLRTFAAAPQGGWRCSLTGETEYLCTERKHLDAGPGKRKSSKHSQFNPATDTETLWTRIADRRPAWARQGEHLGAISAIKRLWPTIFADEVARITGQAQIGRFVVSTHTMALAHQLDNWLARAGISPQGFTLAEQKYRSRLDPVALPRLLVKRHARVQPEALKDAAILPALLDYAGSGDFTDQEEPESIRRLVRQTLAGGQDGTRSVRLETYYGMLMLDGDKMGAWLAGGSDGQDEDGEGSLAISYLDSFHPQVRAGFEQHAARQEQIRAYGRQRRALSPGRHLSISAALNDFSLTVARHVVEEEFPGRLIYAGGDDVLALTPVADLLEMMMRLRYAYSGHDPRDDADSPRKSLVLQRGFALLRQHHGQRLMRMMGTRATASCGAVIAHHQAPLTAVRRALANAEQRAKHEGGRNAFSITLIKRSGGALYLTDKWGESLGLLQDLQTFLGSAGVSRRAAYHALQWLDDRLLPLPEGDGDMLLSLLSQQFRKQSDNAPEADSLAGRLLGQAMAKPAEQRISWLRNFMAVAEFMARDVRAKSGENPA